MAPSPPPIAAANSPPSDEEWLPTLDGSNLDWLLELCADDNEFRPAGCEGLQGGVEPLETVIAPVLIPNILNGPEATVPLTHAPTKENVSSSSDTASSTTSPVSARSRTRAKSPTRGSVWPPKRMTPKQRIEVLRVQVSKLTLELNTLKQMAGISLETPVARIPPRCRNIEATHLAKDDAPDLGLWEKLAGRQQQQRRRAEDENHELRKAVSTHARRAKRLRQLVEKFESEMCQLSRVVLSNPQAIVPTSLTDDEAVFQRLSVGMDELYANVDSHFHKVKMHEVPRPGRLGSARRIGPEEWSVEIRDVMLMPFDMKRTDRALWIQHGETNGRNNSREVRRSFQFGIDLVMATQLSQQQRSVIRRYCEEDRTVTIHRQQIEPIPGMMVHVTMQKVIKKGPDSVAGPTSEVETTVLGRVFATAEAQVFILNAMELLNPNGIAKDDFAATIWQKWDSSISLSHDKLESRLVEEGNAPRHHLK